MSTARRAQEFEAWWEKEGQYARAGGGGYEKTFAFNAWMAATPASEDESDESALATLLAAAQTEADFEAIPLKACPFCGPGQSVVSLWKDDVAQRYRVCCGRCGSSTGVSPRDCTPRSAIESWNRRVSI